MKLLRVLPLVISTILVAMPSSGGDFAVTSHGLEIHYRIFGQGAPVLVLGGGPGDVADRYVSLCQLLAKNMQCILVEQRGTGRSTPAVQNDSTISVALTLDDFEAIRQQLKFEKWSVLGFSYGGYLASLYTHFFPDSVSSLILLSSMGLNWKGLQQFEDNIYCRLWPSDLQLVEYWNDPKRKETDLKLAITETIRAKMPGYFFDRKKSLLVSQVIKVSDFDFEMGDWIFKDILKRDLDLAKMKGRFAGPVLILHGRQDPSGESVPLALAQYYQKSKLVFIEKCGHYSWVEQGENVSTQIVDFLKPQ